MGKQFLDIRTTGVPEKTKNDYVPIDQIIAQGGQNAKGNFTFVLKIGSNFTWTVASAAIQPFAAFNGIVLPYKKQRLKKIILGYQYLIGGVTSCPPVRLNVQDVGGTGGTTVINPGNPVSPANTTIQYPSGNLFNYIFPGAASVNEIDTNLIFTTNSFTFDLLGLTAATFGIGDVLFTMVEFHFEVENP